MPMNTPKDLNTLPEKPPFFKRTDLILVSILVSGALALGLFMWMGRTVSGKEQAVVTIGYAGTEQQTLIIPLDKDGITLVEGGLLPVRLEVKDGGIRFVDSVCPDHLCEGFGWLRYEGDWAACLPAGVTVNITVDR